MSFAIDPATDALRARIDAFVRERIVPLEAGHAHDDEHDNLRLDVLEGLRAEVKAAGLWTPQMPRALGGLGLSMRALVPLYEAMNFSIFGPPAFNCAAPDDGNMRVLAQVASAAQQARWLAPIVDGRVRSAFAMTEPHPGGGSDPTMIRTRAVRRGAGWVIDGRKWFITGAGIARHFIVVARTSDDPRRGLTAFVCDRDTPGLTIARRIPVMGPEEHGGHCEVVFESMTIGDDQRLMQEGDGLKLTQIRLGPARLTHCMRWLGLARRSLAVAAPYVAERQSGGRALAAIDSVRAMLADAAMAIDVARLLTLRAAEALDRGEFARREISMAKVSAADALQRAADTGIQLLGARGYSTDTPLEWIYRYARQARLVDGASEVHRGVIAGALLDDPDTFWRWPVAAPQ
ncbi:MAG TPA: acyl-CoA dehydrogenase family protein [Casimicrobiaceae bacterium]|jgi:acyl-CoA dehydrogenase|nr:acyl-CoA dehydrogenase family protein [Casimicrobiaceae bacterium]